MPAGGNYNFSFTSFSSQACGNNTVLKLGRYCNFSGDVNQDGAIMLDDVILIGNDAIAFASGYIVTDLNGNNSLIWMICCMLIIFRSGLWR